MLGSGASSRSSGIWSTGSRYPRGCRFSQSPLLVRRSSTSGAGRDWLTNSQLLAALIALTHSAKPRSEPHNERPRLFDRLLRLYRLRLAGFGARRLAAPAWRDHDQDPARRRFGTWRMGRRMVESRG